MKKFKSFEDARYWARFSGIKTSTEWEKRGRAGLPDDIPTCPHQTYKDEWHGWANFLGTEKWDNISCSKKLKRQIYQFLSMFSKKVNENPDIPLDEIAKDKEIQLKSKSIYELLPSEDEEEGADSFSLRRLIEGETKSNDDIAFFLWSSFWLLDNEGYLKRKAYMKGIRL